MTVLVEGFAPDAVAVARLLAGEGAHVRLAGRGDAPPAAASLEALGVAIEPNADLDADPGTADIAYLDVWTPETAPRVAALRRRGVRVTCASELVLARAATAGARTVGVTGTAGKTTTATFTSQLLRAAGVGVLAAEDGRLGNLWVTHDVVDRIETLGRDQVVVIELTSSHLAFMRSSPDVAVVTCFWADHVELHGSLRAYRSAKETIVRHQGAAGAVVASAEDDAVSTFTALTPARRFAWSLEHPVEAGAYLRDGDVTLCGAGPELALGRAPATPVLVPAALAACATAVALGVPGSRLAGKLQTLVPPPHRQTSLGPIGGVEVVDDGMAATPAKARAALAGRADGSVVLIAGGRLSTEGGLAHASGHERRLLAACCDEIERAASHVVLFGEAASTLVPELSRRGVTTSVVVDLAAAVREALGVAREPAAVVFAPLFPVAAEDRARFPDLVVGTGAAMRVRDSRP